MTCREYGPGYDAFVLSLWPNATGLPAYETQMLVGGRQGWVDFDSQVRLACIQVVRQLFGGTKPRAPGSQRSGCGPSLQDKA